MSGFGAALWCELLKVRRSRLPLWTALGLSMGPLFGALFMFIMKDPERARQMGLLGTKAQIAGVADWPSYFTLLGQVVSIGGLLVFSLAASWVVGREFADRTVRDQLALPTPRAAIVVTKLIVVAGWAVALTVLVLLLGLAVGWVVRMPGWSSEVLLRGIALVLACGGLTALLVMPIALLAGVGRGYLVPMGGALLVLALGQIAGALGWGAYFPWSVPALVSGVTGPPLSLPPISYLLVCLTGAAGVAGSIIWWRHADQT